MNGHIALGMIIIGTLTGSVCGALALIAGAGILKALLLWSICGVGTVTGVVLTMTGPDDENASGRLTG